MNRAGRRKGKKASWAVAGALAVMLAAGALLVWLESGYRVSARLERFTESDKALDNPDRGMYSIYQFLAGGQGEAFTQEYTGGEQAGGLVLVEINLERYRSQPISTQGLEEVRGVFSRLHQAGKRLIVRFMYDWQGENLEQEPEDIQIILGHMEQLGPVLLEFAGDIFTLQGLFVGNWGEGNGTRYSTPDCTRLLAEKLAEATEGRLFLAVRTPAQWRSAACTGTPSGVEEPWDRLGLFNDGMLGNNSDFGAYSLEEAPDQGDILSPWSREAELAFQEELCRRVPNGGEVINSNFYNDFENALADLRTMRVSYLNQDYDPAVLRKWAKASYQGGGVFRGMDGLTYIQRHLGYRLLVSGVEVSASRREQAVFVEVAMKNAGFAPIYREPEMAVVFVDGQGREAAVCPIPQELRQLAGGNQAGESLTLRARAGREQLPPGEYTAYFSIIDPLTGGQLELANTQEPEAWGYRLGELLVQA